MSHRPNDDDGEQRLLATVQSFLAELHDSPPQARLTSRLDQELGLDSLGRAQLIARLEREFQVQVSAAAVNAVDCQALLDDLLGAIASVDRGPSEVASTVPAHDHRTQSGTPAHQARTLNEVLMWHAEQNPSRTAIVLYSDSPEPELLTTSGLLQSASRLANGLTEAGIERGESVAIMLGTEAGYFYSFFGILLAGGIPVPIYPPARPAQLEDHLRRHVTILTNAQCRLLITRAEAKLAARFLTAQIPTLATIATVADLTVQSATASAQTQVYADDPAFIQYTSGSTGDPKGVVLSHSNLLANVRAMAQRIEVNADDVFVSWLPLYHDMGLIGACLGSLQQGIPLVSMSPLAFLRNPSQWLWTIHHHRGTLSAGPNFAYELCMRTFDPQRLDGLDLSTWRFAANGAEPVSVATMERFATHFKPYGFKPSALAPVYGLAECSVGLALPNADRGLRQLPVDRERLNQTGSIEIHTASSAATTPLAACGHALDRHELRIVDDHGNELPDLREGRVQFRGPSATRGYHNNPTATAELFDGSWLNTGDRGFVDHGDLFLTGRSKDMIIRAGRNLYPYELEQAIGGLAGIRKGCVAVFASVPTEGTRERLIIVAETRETEKQRQADLERAIQAVTSELLGTPADEILLAPPHAVLKTSSGKIRRSAMNERYQTGEVGAQRSVSLQVLRLALSGARSITGRWLRLVVRWSYNLYAALVGLLLTIPIVLGLLFLPTLKQRWGLCRALLRCWFAAIAIPISVRKAEQRPNDAYLLVANHSSYLDSFLIICAHPEPLRFIAKKELSQQPAIGWLLGRLGVILVDRFDHSKSDQTVDTLVQAAAEPLRLAFFPEGTFVRAPGILPFRMGAFVAAAATGRIVVPLAIIGSRSILRAGTWLLHRGAIKLCYGQPITPPGRDWAAAAHVQRHAKQQISEMTGEPALHDVETVFSESRPSI